MPAEISPENLTMKTERHFDDFQSWPDWVSGSFGYTAFFTKCCLVVFIPLAVVNTLGDIPEEEPLPFFSLVFWTTAFLVVACFYDMHAKLRRLWRESAVQHSHEWLKRVREDLRESTVEEQTNMLASWRAARDAARTLLREELAWQYNKWWIRLFGLRPDGWTRWRSLNASDFRGRESIAHENGNPDLFLQYQRGYVLSEAGMLPVFRADAMSRSPDLDLE